MDFRLGGTQEEGERKVLPPSRRQPRRREQMVAAFEKIAKEERAKCCRWDDHPHPPTSHHLSILFNFGLIQSNMRLDCISPCCICVCFFFFFFLFFLLETRISRGTQYCQWVMCTVHGTHYLFDRQIFHRNVSHQWVSCTVYETHKPLFSATFSLKIGSMALFTHLKFILLQCFQFSVK